MKSVSLAGKGIGSHRNWLGEVATSLKGALRSSPQEISRKGLCITEGRMR